ncbi:MAG: hypothetical protein R3324_00425 [Halobacteriales archaeon]|nr:hypothetical protein [Halobacteriales archaeon]
MDKRWHQGRKDARRNYHSADELSDEEQVFLSIGENSDYPLVITGELNPETWTVEDPFTGKEHDLREIVTIGGAD